VDVRFFFVSVSGIFIRYIKIKRTNKLLAQLINTFKIKICYTQSSNILSIALFLK
jgi:hypothetical protein